MGGRFLFESNCEVLLNSYSLNNLNKKTGGKMACKIIQLDMFITDLKELEKHQQEERDRKNNRKLRAAFHLLSDLGKELKEKTP